jgi:16S rRNA (uracil1498-N3)-methyltransferase
MQLFFSDNLEKKITLTNEEEKHITRVLRKKIGDNILFTNGKGLLYTGEITALEKNTPKIEIIKKENKEKIHNYYLHIAIAPTKNINRFEWFLEKATEIGIDEITPFFCERSERKKINQERCMKILISSMKQSLKYHLPKLNNPVLYTDFIKQDFKGDKFIAHCLNKDKTKLDKSINPRCNILIGPEGDFSENEINLAIKNNFQSLSLGKSRLRTETAGVIATHSVNRLFE